MMLSRALVLFAASVILSACESNSLPPCPPDGGECADTRDGGALADAEAIAPDAGAIDLDAGTGTPACRNQLELCSVPSDCCTPYACTNGTCR